VTMMTDTSPKLSGEPTAQALASGLATLGRYGDNYMVHAAEGETVVPKEILDANPGLKDNLFKQMQMMGIENPNRYVVGSELNSINPITGQPEFFFKKIFKAIKKVAKKVLPIAAPIIGNLIAPGIGGILASGLTSKLTGGSWGDALKSMALSYGAGALGRGIMGGLSSTGTFAGGLTKGLTQPFSAASNLFSSGAANPLAQGVFGPRGPIPIAFSGLSQTNPSFANAPFGGGTGIMDKIFPEYDPQAAIGGATAQAGAATVKPSYQGTPEQFNLEMDAAREATNLRGAALEDYVISGRARGLPGKNFDPIPPTFDQKLGSFLAPTESSGKGLEGLLGKKGAEVVAKIADKAALPLGLAGAAYFLSPEEESRADQLSQLGANNPQRVAYDQWQKIPDKNSDEARRLKLIWYGEPAYSAPALQSSYGANPLQGITPGTLGAPRMQVLNQAAGGEVMGPGTGTSDSIPAMLSDGEFVMTAKAVRNAGNGDRDVGAARMYDMMNRFERGMA